MKDTLSITLFSIFCLIAVFSFSSCAVQERRVTPPDRRITPRMPIQPISEMAPPKQAALGNQVFLPPYRVSFNDVINIKFVNNPEMNTNAKIQPDGRIALDKIGELFILGLTTREVDSLVTHKFSRIVRSPVVNVSLVESAPKNVFILGEVRSPGGYPVEPGMTILRAIALAGGSSDDAKLSSVILMRTGYFREPRAYRVDLDDFTKKIGLANDPLLEPFDIIYIPKTFVGDLRFFFDRVFDVVNRPLDTILRSYFLLESLNFN